MLRFLLALLIFTATLDEPKPDLPTALAKIQAQDFTAAANMLDELTRLEPKNPLAWRALGFSYLKLHKPDQSIDAFLHAHELAPQLPAPIYNLGLAYALKGDPDHAFEWLTKVRKTGKFDMTQIETAPELAALKTDPRFTALLPTRHDFDNPFVENVKILHEWDGEAANGQFGWIARNIGDVDGDHVPDFVTSAPSLNNNAGRIYVYSTRTGKLLWQADGAPGDQLGLGVEAAGDHNVIASSPIHGYAKIYSGRDGKVLHTLHAEDPVNDQFGQHVSGAGNLVIVGAPGRKEGRAYVYNNKTGALLLTLKGEREGDNFGSAVAVKNNVLVVGAPKAGPRKSGKVYVYKGLTDKPSFTIDSDETGGALGAMFLSIPGDLDGDGIPDIYASDWQNTAKGPSTGRIYVHSGKDGHRLLTLTGETPGEGFGTSPSPAGDVDGDGHADLIVGAWQYNGGGGRAYLYSGKNGSLLKTFTDRIPGDTFGFDALTMGDTDHDGATDFLITAAWSAVNGFHSGRIFLISSGITPTRKANP